MTYHYVIRPRFAIMSKNGNLEELFCKLCGTAIAGVQSTPRGTRRDGDGNWIEEHALVFRRFPNYAELKMKFEDGSFHVTNGCGGCLHFHLTVEQLHELHCADMDLEDTATSELNKNRIPEEVVDVRLDGGGIV